MIYPKVQCPHCGNTGKGEHIIYHVEWVPVYRRLEGVRSHRKAKGMPVYYLDYEDAHNATEDSKDPMFQCGDCDNQWTVSRRSITHDVRNLEGTRFSDMTEEEKSHVDAPLP